MLTDVLRIQMAEITAKLQHNSGSHLCLALHNKEGIGA